MLKTLLLQLEDLVDRNRHTGCHYAARFVWRDNLVSVMYAEELDSGKSLAILQRTDRRGILDQKPADFQRAL
jgi:hypothetical protein